MAGNKALVAGATGVVGRYLLMHLIERGGWEVVAVSRRKPDAAGDYRHVPADLTDAQDCRSKLSALRAGISGTRRRSSASAPIDG